MFVKIVRYEKETEGRHECLYECARLLSSFKPGPDGMGLLLTFEESGKGAVTVEIDGSENGVSVYVMNDEGRTIDALINKGV